MWNWPFQVNLSLIMEKSLQNHQNWPFWANLSHFFSKIHHSGSFLALWCERNQKSWKSQSILGNYGKKPAKWPKLAVLSHSNTLFWENLPLWLIFSHFGVKGIKKVEKLKNVPDVHPTPRNGNFWDFGSNEMLWWQKMGKVVNYVKLAILSESEPHYGEKSAKWPKLAILSQYNTLFWENLPLWVIFSHFGVKGIKKVEKLKYLLMYPHQKWNFLRFQIKWDALVAKDGKSCELHEIGHCKWIWASLWGKTCKMTKIGHFDLIYQTFSAKFTILGHFKPLWCEKNKKRLKSWKILPMYPSPPEIQLDPLNSSLKYAEILWWTKRGGELRG